MKYNWDEDKWLKDGLIPANSNCPFRVICPIAKRGVCQHKGLDHQKDFSCASARAYSMLEKWEPYDER